MKRFASAALLSLLVGTGAALAQTGGHNAPEQLAKPYVVLLSFDGFRHDYLERVPLPSFRRLMEGGSRAEALIPAFPSKTFPNHITVATGLGVARHGIVANRFFDPARNRVYQPRPPEVAEPEWYHGEPIWVTAEKQGMVTAAYFWPTVEAPRDGITPSRYHAFDEDTSPDSQVAAVLHWLAEPPRTRPHFVALYVALVDQAGHGFGPESPQVDSALLRADALLGTLLDGIERLPIAEQVNLIVLSDHGMMHAEGRIFLDDHLVIGQGELVEPGPVVSLYLGERSHRVDAVFDTLSRALRHARVYRRSDLPEHWGLRDHPRAGDLLVVADSGHIITLRRLPRDRNPGTHGFDPAMPAMHGIFIARGPGIRPEVRLGAVANVDVYPLLAALLGLRPAPGIDGSDLLARQLVRHSRPASQHRIRSIP